MLPHTSLIFFSIFLQSFLETGHNSMDWKYPLFSLQSWTFRGDLPVQHVWEWETRLPKPPSSCPSPQQSRPGIAQAENPACGYRDISPQVILTHFSIHFLRHKAHQTDISAPSTAPLSRHSSDPGARTLWGRGSEGWISGNYGNLNGQQAEQKISPQADKALGSCPACTGAVDPYRMQSAPSSAEFYFSCLFGQIMETGIKNKQDSHSWTVS